MGRLRAATGLFAMLVVSLPAMGADPLAVTKVPDWDQVANIKDAAVRLAKMQQTRGAERAFAFISACYKTHSLSSKYTKALEACIAQDYLETQALALVYSRLPPETLKRLGAPSPQKLADAMGRRILAAFANYDMSVEYANTFKGLVDEHGFPIFFGTLFPGAKLPPAKGLATPEQE